MPLTLLFQRLLTGCKKKTVISAQQLLMWCFPSSFPCCRCCQVPCWKLEIFLPEWWLDFILWWRGFSEWLTQQWTVVVCNVLEQRNVIYLLLRTWRVCGAVAACDRRSEKCWDLQLKCDKVTVILLKLCKYLWIKHWWRIFGIRCMSLWKPDLLFHSWFQVKFVWQLVLLVVDVEVHDLCPLHSCRFYSDSVQWFCAIPCLYYQNYPKRG